MASWQKATLFFRRSENRGPAPLPLEAAGPNRSAPMNFRPTCICPALLGVLVFAVPLALATPASAQTKLKLVLNWKYQGPQGMFFLAEDRGYYKAEGLEVTLDQGNGSGAAVPLVANGTYDAGFGDINALIELAARKPEDAPIAVYVMFNQPPFTVAVKAESAIKSPKDFEGKTLGGAANDGARKLFPAFCKLARIDCSKVNITNMQPNLREQMLMQGQVDGVFGYLNTIRFSAKLMGVEDKQLHQLRRLRHGSLFQCHYRLAEAHEGEAGGRARPGAGHQPGNS